MQESRQTNLGLRAELARVEELLTQREYDLAELRRALPLEGGLNGASYVASSGVDDGVHALIEGAGGALDRGDPEELEMFLRDCVNKLREVAGACKEADEAGAQGTAHGESLQVGIHASGSQPQDEFGQRPVAELRAEVRSAPQDSIGFNILSKQFRPQDAALLEDCSVPDGGLDEGLSMLIEQALGALDRGDAEEQELFLRDCVDKLKEVKEMVKEQSDKRRELALSGQSQALTHPQSAYPEVCITLS